MKAVSAAFVLAIIVSTVVLAGTLGPVIDPLVSLGQSTPVLQLDWLQGLIERIDRLLESLVDLVRTVRELAGTEGGG